MDLNLENEFFRSKRSGPMITLEALLFMLFILWGYATLCYLCYYVISGSIIWSTCIFKNKFYKKDSKTASKRKTAKILLSVYISSIIIMFFAAYIALWLKQKFDYKTEETVIDRLDKIALITMGIGCFLIASGILTTLCFGIQSCFKYNDCTPKIELESLEESGLKNGEPTENGENGCDTKVEMIEIKPC